VSRFRTPFARRAHRRAGRVGTAALAALALTACGNDAGTGRVISEQTPPVTGTAPPTAPDPTPAPPPSCAQQTLDRLDLRARVGQLLLVGVPAADPVAGFGQLSGVPVGGVFLEGRSSAGAEAIGAATAQLQRSSPVPLQIAVDQEGGRVQALRGPGFDPVPAALAQGAVPPAALQAEVRSWAGQLHGSGITMDLAPVADTVPAGRAAANPPIGALDRQYGSDPAQVAAAVGAVVGALQGAGVAATVKHFPGLGRVQVNTDTGVGARDPETTPADPYLQPFAAAVSAGTAAVMVSSASYPQLDPDRLAVFSPVVLGLLRDQLGFRGVVVTDDLGHAAALSGVPVGQRAVDAVGAGVDVVLTVRAADAAPMSDALLDRATADPGFAARVGESAARVLALKERFGLLTC
jgi:beta-N-acetylhexosaminidase